ncbi:hypothetical protein Hypma_013831 [Hypsizygus marmoreus]|uniref:Fungal-type protein kinase domain-containing protein n=1 Tax=Hypsizygus marmoreus TaxID=39966 RepID=A0A369K549_HYPMA|nr:hypothetical protein Hypma_013831 [Hypsizygus marmoreus]
MSDLTSKLQAQETSRTSNRTATDRDAITDKPKQTQSRDTRDPVTPPPSVASALPPRITKMHATPISHKSSGASPFTSNHHFTDLKFQKLANEMSSKFVGPMNPAVFLNEFLPLENEQTKTPWSWDESLKERSTVISKKRTETEMYDPLITALTSACGGSLVLVNTSAHIDPDAGILVPEGLKPDIGAYEAGYRAKTSKVTDFSLLEIHMELKKAERDDGFDDCGSESFENSSQNSTDTRGQITGYATAQLGLQFRTHIFSVLLCGSHARLIRWDRTGAIVSSRFNYTQEDFLLQFFWRYSQLSPEDRGKDTSVCEPTAEEAQATRVGLGMTGTDTLLKFTVVDETTKESLYFVGNEQGLKANSSPTGRATRTYKVWDLKRKRRALLKDTWRVDLPDMEKEGQIYQTLHEKKVPYISKIVCAGDVYPSTGVDNHRTRTHLYGDSNWLKLQPKWIPIEGLRPHSHYRIVLKKIAEDLIDFESSKQLVTAAKHALEAVVAAYQEAHIMHRDISIGNIMITKKGRGLLIDWDLAKRFTIDDETKTKQLGKPRQIERSQFISVRLLLSSVPLAHTLADDMESLLHVLSWVALRYMSHAMRPADLSKTLETTFDGHYKEGLQWVGDRSKKIFLTGREISRIGLKNAVFVYLLRDLTDIFAVEYEEPEPRAFEKYNALMKQGGLSTGTPQEKKLANQVVDYNERKAQRESPEWVLGIFEQALEDSSWLPDDSRVMNKLPTKRDGGRKRKTADDEIPSDRSESRRKVEEDGRFVNANAE